MATLDAQSISEKSNAYIAWSAVIAGAVVASAISFLLLTFGGAVGLSLTSPWPGAGARLWVVALAVMWWLVAVQIGSFAAGGYLAGRLRSHWGTTPSAESQFRDGVHGLLVWSVGVLFGALLLAWVGAGTAKTAAQSASLAGGAAASGAPSKATPSDYAVDILLRPQPAQPAAVPSSDAKPTSGDDGAVRAEAGRIFTRSIANSAISQPDYNYLVQLVQTRTGLSQTDAQARVQSATNEAKEAEIKVREQADKARKSAVLTAFVAAVSLLVSLAAATAAAAAGGRHRDENRVVLFSGHRFW